jgi:myo-inositol-1(or 4)-monophosphatase
MKLNPYTRVALAAARAGGEVLRAHFDKKLRVDFKGTIDPVTNADRQSQRAVFSVISRHFPGHSTLGEEGVSTNRDADYCWIVDPLDGTVNFIHRIPLFCVSVALMHRGKIVSGVVHAPLMRESFVAQRGTGAWLNGTRIRVSETGSLVRALAATGFPYYVHERPGRAVTNLVNVLQKVQGIRRLGSAAIDLAYVAMGRCDAFWEEGLAPWDVAAGTLLVEEAGGKVTDYCNGDDYIFGKTLLSSNGRIHRPLFRLISA